MFILDPNGVSNYLSKYMSDDKYSTVSIPYFTDMMSQYVKHYNELNNTTYEFYTELEHPCQINITNPSSYSYDHGHCAQLSLMLIYIMYTNQDIMSETPIKDLSLVFQPMSNSVLCNIKYNFSGNLHRILHENFIIKDTINSVQI